MGDAFPNNAELDANDYPSRLNDEDVVRIAEFYNIPPQYEVVCPSPGDRTCNWDPEDLFIYEDAFRSGLRFPLNEFIPRLLAEARINPSVEIIDDDQGRGDKVTKRMMKKLAERANPPEPTTPAFLQHSQQAGKRFRDADGHMQTAFMPAWGICDQHSVSGSSLLAKDWSRECITPPDRTNIVERTSLDEAEQLGASAAYNESERALQKEKVSLTRAMNDWESRAHSAEDMVTSLQNRMKTLEEGLEKNKGMIIHEYMDSDPFLQFMDDHDDRVRPSVFTSGWDKALETVVADHPGMFDPSRYPSPYLPAQSLATASLSHVPAVVDVEEVEGAGVAVGDQTPHSALFAKIYTQAHVITSNILSSIPQRLVN
ncbi:hypothetical protein ACET3Z_004894 [Daucus carota]